MLTAPSPLVWAHRGSPRGRGDLPPENTLLAFRRAVELGADGLEFDLHATRDGHLVVHHDLHLVHPRLGTQALPDLLLAEVREVLLGPGKTEPIPTFREVVECVAGRDLPLVPELKLPEEAEARGLDMVELFAREAEELELTGRLIVQCFHRETLDRVRTRMPQVEILALYRHDQCIEFQRIPGRAEYLGIPMLVAFFLGEALMQHARGRGARVVPWSDMSLSENPEMFERMRSLSVHAVMVDDAERALALYGRRPPLPPEEVWGPELLCREEPVDTRRTRHPEVGGSEE